MTHVDVRPEAEADLIDIGLYIAEYSTTRARSVVQRLRLRARLLKTHPEAGRPRPELGDGIRSLIDRPYVLLYRIEGAAVEVVAILHGARDLPTVLSARLNAERDD